MWSYFRSVALGAAVMVASLVRTLLRDRLENDVQGRRRPRVQRENPPSNCREVTWLWVARHKRLTAYHYGRSKDDPPSYEWVFHLTQSCPLLQSSRPDPLDDVEEASGFVKAEDGCATISLNAVVCAVSCPVCSFTEPLWIRRL